MTNEEEFTDRCERLITSLSAIQLRDCMSLGGDKTVLIFLDLSRPASRQFAIETGCVTEAEAEATTLATEASRRASGAQVGVPFVLMGRHPKAAAAMIEGLPRSTGVPPKFRSPTKAMLRIIVFTGTDSIGADNMSTLACGDFDIPIPSLPPEQNN